MNNIELSRIGPAAAAESDGDELVSLMGRRTPGEASKGTGTEKSPQCSTLDSVVFGAAVITMTCSMMALLMEQSSILVLVSMSLSLLTSTCVAYQRAQLRRMEPLRAFANNIRDQVNQLQGENDFMALRNDELRVRVDDLKEKEQRLGEILAKQSMTVADFRRSIKENNKIVNDIKERLETTILHDLISQVLRADRDADFVIDLDEVNDLCSRFENFTGIRFDEAQFRIMMEKREYGIAGILDIVDNIFDKSIEEEEKIFRIETRGLHPGDIV